VDAICINQRDGNEKSWQVQLTRGIYQHASHATVWLGPSNTSTDLAMDYLKRL
ncbi:uncharacterized protein BDR25DRAFT_202949, partial [Lindgomyces ingoldianus]